MSSEKAVEVKIVESELKKVNLEDLIDDVDQDISKFSEDQENKSKKYIPVSYLNEGEYVVRLHPDVDENGKGRIFRRVFFHKLMGIDESGKEFEFRVLEDNSINNKLDEAKNNGFSDSWKFKSKEHVFCFCRIISSPNNGKFSIKEDTDVLLVLTPQQYKQINEFLSSLSRDDRLKCLDITSPYHAIKFKVELVDKYRNITKINYDSNIHDAVTSFKLPEGVTYTGLSDCYISEKTGKISNIQLKSFNKWLSQKTTFSNNISDPLEDPFADNSNYSPRSY